MYRKKGLEIYNLVWMGSLYHETVDTNYFARLWSFYGILLYPPRVSEILKKNFTKRNYNDVNLPDIFKSTFYFYLQGLYESLNKDKGGTMLQNVQIAITVF